MDSFLQDVKFNCDVSDAKYWGFFSICGLLMRFRDLYRSEKGMKPWERINQEDIFEWISRKEERWRELEKKDFRDIQINGARYHYLDAAGINDTLRQTGLVYGSGYGLYMKPSFFVAETYACTEMYGHTVCVAGEEYVRDIFSSPGMAQGKTIFLRRMPLKTLLWEKFQESRTKNRSCLNTVFSHYGVTEERGQDKEFERNFDTVVTKCADIVIRHEVAEAVEEVSGWLDILVTIGDRKVEYFLRAVKDLLSDTSERGPLKTIIDGRDADSLCLYLSLLSSYHTKLYAEIKHLSGSFTDVMNWDAVEEVRKAGFQKFALLREQIIRSYRESNDTEEVLSRIKKIQELAKG